MRVRGWGWVLPATTVLGWSALVGCSSASDDAAGGDYGEGHWGGQTGSLVPCSTPAFRADEPSVPSGDAALVFHTGNCAPSFNLTDANGEAVDFELVQVDDGVLLLKTETALTPGDYQVEGSDGQSTTVTVTEPEQLPTRAGTLQRTPDRTCSRGFTLTLDEHLMPYLPLLKLDYALDAEPRQPWFEFGTVPSGATAVTLGIPLVEPGEHQLTVFAMIAGETEQPDPAQLSFSFEHCPSSEPDSGAICSVGRPGMPNAPLTPLGLVLGGLAILGLRLRRRRGR